MFKSAFLAKGRMKRDLRWRQRWKGRGWEREICRGTDSLDATSFLPPATMHHLERNSKRQIKSKVSSDYNHRNNTIICFRSLKKYILLIKIGLFENETLLFDSNQCRSPVTPVLCCFWIKYSLSIRRALQWSISVDPRKKFAESPDSSVLPVHVKNFYLFKPLKTLQIKQSKKDKPKKVGNYWIKQTG